MTNDDSILLGDASTATQIAVHLADSGAAEGTVKVTAAMQLP